MFILIIKVFIYLNSIQTHPSVGINHKSGWNKIYVKYTIWLVPFSYFYTSHKPKQKSSNKPSELVRYTMYTLSY